MTLNCSLSNTGQGLFDLIHFIMHNEFHNSETEALLMTVLIIRANINLIIDSFIEATKDILGKEYVEEKIKKYESHDESNNN